MKKNYHYSKYISKKNENEKGVGTVLFCRINLMKIPFKLVLFTNNHILDRNIIKKGKNIIFGHKDKPSSKVLEIYENRIVFTSEELDYICIEIFEEDHNF